MRARTAFSVVELLTALVLFAVGFAAFVRAAAAVARLESDARLRHTVATVVQARLDSLLGHDCHAGFSGQVLTQGVLERWNVRADGRHLMLSDTVTVRARPALARGYSVAIACQP